MQLERQQREISELMTVMTSSKCLKEGIMNPYQRKKITNEDKKNVYIKKHYIEVSVDERNLKFMNP
jgi:hypothetical protein